MVCVLGFQKRIAELAFFVHVSRSRWAVRPVAQLPRACVSPVGTRETIVVLKVPLYFSLSGIKLCALEKSVCRVLPMYPCK